QQDVIEEDGTETHRQEHVRRDQAEGQHAGHQPTIQTQLVHDEQQRRDQQRDEGNVDRQNVLRSDRRAEQQDQQYQAQLAGTGLAAAVDHAQSAIGQRMGSAGLGDGHREGAEQGIAQGDCRTLAQTSLKGLQGIIETQATGQASGQSTYNQCNNNVYATQTQRQHHTYC